MRHRHQLFSFLPPYWPHRESAVPLPYAATFYACFIDFIAGKTVCFPSPCVSRAGVAPASARRLLLSTLQALAKLVKK